MYTISPTATVLYLHRRGIGNTEVKALCDFLKCNTKFTRLNLSDNEINDEGVQILCEVLKYNTSLTVLDLSRNDITDEGAIALGDTLKFNNTLIELNLGGTCISDKGIKVLMDALKYNSTHKNSTPSRALQPVLYSGADSKLAILSLNENLFNSGDERAKVLGRALKDNNILTELNLEYNIIGNEGAKLLGKALKYNTKLTGLNLSHNRIGNEGAKSLGKALQCNTSLTELNLSFNRIDQKTKEILIKIKSDRLSTRGRDLYNILIILCQYFLGKKSNLNLLPLEIIHTIIHNVGTTPSLQIKL